MNRLVILLAVSAICSTCGCIPTTHIGGVNPYLIRHIKPISIKFSSPNMLLKPEKDDTLELILRSGFLRENIIFNAQTEDQRGPILCNALSTRFYTDVFRLREFDIHRVSVKTKESELISMLGEPEVREGPLDTEGTVLVQWRMCERWVGNQFKAREITAGYNPMSKELRFIFFREGQSQTEANK